MGLYDSSDQLICSVTKTDYDDHPNVGDIDPDETTFTCGGESIDVDTSCLTKLQIGDILETNPDDSYWKIDELEHSGGFGQTLPPS